MTMKFSTFAFVLAASSATATKDESSSSSILPHLDHTTFSQALDAVRAGRQPDLQQLLTNGKLRRGLGEDVDEDGGGEDEDAAADSLTCEEALEAWTEHLASPSWLFVQMADDCVFQVTKNGNTIMKSKKYHEDTEAFTDRPLSKEETIPTDEFFDDFNNAFDDELGMPNAAITLVQNDESKDVVISVFAKAMVTNKDSPDGPTYVYKLEQSEEQAAIVSLEDVMGGSDKVKYDHCSIFIDSISIGNNYVEQGGTQYITDNEQGYNAPRRCGQSCSVNENCNPNSDGCSTCSGPYYNMQCTSF